MTDTARSGPHILMCPPDFYRIEYEINPWMSRERQADPALAVEQWNGLRQLLESLGAKISIVPPVEGLPDMVFTANAAMLRGDTAIISNFRPLERRGEQDHYEAWLAGHGFKTVRLPEDVYFEGAGDALFCGETLYAGYRIRSDAGGHQRIGRMLSVRVLPLELVDPYYYHLDTCFCPLAADMAICYLPAFDQYGQQVLRETVPTLLPASDETARRFGCNAVVVGKSVVTNTGCRDLHDALRRLGFTPYETPLDEFVKAGGSAKCLTLRLDGEEATRSNG